MSLLLFYYGLVLVVNSIFTIYAFRQAIKYSVQRMYADRKTDFNGYWLAKNMTRTWERAYLRSFWMLILLLVGGAVTYLFLLLA